MALAPVLVDSWALVALLNSDDQWHQNAVAISHRLEQEDRRLVVTDWILSEFLSSSARPPLREPAVVIVENLLASALVEVVPASRDNWKRGFDLYRSRPDKSWSLVDCISIDVCQRGGIMEVFTGDRHFEQAGLVILLTNES